MKNFICFIFILNTLTCNLFAQEKQTDTIKTIIKAPDVLENIQYRLDEFDFYREIYHYNLNILSDKDFNTLQLKTEMLIRYSAKNNFSAEENNFYFLSPLYDKYLEESRFNPIRYLLGMAQLGAVGYLAYRHIKKYGFIN